MKTDKFQVVKCSIENSQHECCLARKSESAIRKAIIAEKWNDSRVKYYKQKLEKIQEILEVELQGWLGNEIFRLEKRSKEALIAQEISSLEGSILTLRKLKDKIEVKL